jgi:DNA-binding CsgD family transcriptional regulator
VPLRPRLADIFTARQTEVVKQLYRGKVNKIIAYELKVKESTVTVKVHVRNIMRKLMAKNRTEVALYHQPAYRRHGPNVRRPDRRHRTRRCVHQVCAERLPPHRFEDCMAAATR